LHLFLKDHKPTAKRLSSYYPLSIINYQLSFGTLFAVHPGATVEDILDLAPKTVGVQLRYAAAAPAIWRKDFYRCI
jgi:hypothetical protein